MTLEEIAEDRELLEIARKDIEDALIDYRNSRISEMGRRNGLVVYEKDGKASHIIRFGPETAVRLGIIAIARELKKRSAARKSF